MTDTQTNIPPELLEELNRAETDVGTALAAAEDLIRGHEPYPSFEMFCRLVVESVKTKPADAVNDCLRSVFKQIEFSTMPKWFKWGERLLEPIRAYYLNGAKDADRERLKQTLNSLAEYKCFLLTIRGMEPPIPDAESIEQAYRDFVEALRWFKEHAPAIRELYANLREKRKALEALEVKVREIEQAQSLGEAGRELLGKLDKGRKNLEALIKRLDKIDRERERLCRGIEKTGEESEPKPAAPGENKKPDAGTKPKPGDKKNNQHFKGRLF